MNHNTINMSDRYPFAGDRTFTQDGTMVWNDQVTVQPSLDFSQVSDSTLTDSINESYVTAVGDNETQYLSVLETTDDVSLDDLHNITLENSKTPIQENLQFENINSTENFETNTNEVNDHQVIVFNVDGSDDLYGIQFVQDDEGNIQKYQFKFRTTSDGQLEAIPESIQLLANDVEVNQKVAENEIVVQEANDNGAGEVTETQVFYDAHSDVDETFEEQEEPIQEHIQNGPMYIKGEPEAEENENTSDNLQEHMEVPSEHEELYEGQEVQYEESETEEDLGHYEREDVDVKTGIVENSVANIKQELFQEDSQDTTIVGTAHQEEYEIYEHQDIDIKPIPFQHQNEVEQSISEQDEENQIEGNVEDDNGYVEVDETQETVLEYEHYPSEEIQHIYEETDTNDGQTLQHVGTHFNQVFIKDDSRQKVQRSNQGRVFKRIGKEMEEERGEDQGTYYTEPGIENDSDNDDYQIVEGLHVTAEGDSSCPPYHEPDTILQEVVKKSQIAERANILKQSFAKTTKDSKVKTNKTLVYYVIPHVEKENVNSLPVNYTTTGIFRPVRSNPRSILKSSFPEIQEEVEVKPVLDERLDKRFARSKEAVQARLFNNFISKTTIPHAPVRQTRLPRKQQIKPMDNRRDEEIIVQEVMVGSNGFIENVEEKLKNRDKLEVTQYVILSDSDEDYDPKKGNKKKKKYKKHRREDMEDTEDSDISIIEIRSDNEEGKNDEQESAKRGRGRPKKSIEATDPPDSMKRRRGRPPKSDQNHSDVEDSPQKKCRTESDEIESDTTKKEFNCPHCTKTFPSQNSLSTHIHHHNLENSLRNSQANKINTKSTTIEYRHKCEACQMTFKNSILLKKHVCTKRTQKTNKRLECSMCKKSFPDLTALNIHKRSHIKENLVNSTAVVKISPKKTIPRPSTSKPRSPRKASFKCKDCSRVCFSQESLDLHEKTHRKFTCTSCSATFPSRLLLDAHVRVNCVKSVPHVNKRLSFKIRKSFVQSPRRRSGRFPRKSLAASLNSNSNKAVSNSLHLNLECDHCGEKFKLYQDYFKHQVKMHGLETPDKSVLMDQKEHLHKPKSLHGGIPARDEMRKVFANVRSKIALVTPKKNTN